MTIYDKFSKNYDDDMGGIFNQTRQCIIQDLDTFSDPDGIKKIVDVGCGTGKTLALLGQYFPHAHRIGIDSSSSMLNRLQEAEPDIETLCCDGLSGLKNIDDGSIDLCVLNFILAYIKPEAVFEVLSKKISAHGAILIASSTYDSLQKTQELAQDILQKMDNPGNDIPKNKKELINVLDEYAFSATHYDSLIIQMVFEDADYFYQFAYRQGWLYQYIDALGYADKQDAFANEFSNRFPYDDTLKIEVGLFNRKPTSQR